MEIRGETACEATTNEGTSGRPSGVYSKHRAVHAKIYVAKKQREVSKNAKFDCTNVGGGTKQLWVPIT
jgi:hypothetical protein